MNEEEKDSTVICSACGHKLDNSTKFCTNCGSSIEISPDQEIEADQILYPLRDTKSIQYSDDSKTPVDTPPPKSFTQLKNMIEYSLVAFLILVIIFIVIYIDVSSSISSYSLISMIMFSPVTIGSYYVLKALKNRQPNTWDLTAFFLFGTFIIIVLLIVLAFISSGNPITLVFISFLTFFYPYQIYLVIQDDLKNYLKSFDPTLEINYQLVMDNLYRYKPKSRKWLPELPILIYPLILFVILDSILFYSIFLGGSSNELFVYNGFLGLLLILLVEIIMIVGLIQGTLFARFLLYVQSTIKFLVGIFYSIVFYQIIAGQWIENYTTSSLITFSVIPLYFIITVVLTIIILRKNPIKAFFLI